MSHVRTYKTRNPRKSPLWQCVHRHHDTFVAIYPDAYEHKHGPLRPVVTDVFGKFLDCGTLERGFARIRCDHCENEYLDFHPHVHALVADGLLDSDGTFHLAPEISDSVLSELFRNRVFKELLAHKLISPELVARRKTWKHSGFNVHSGRSVPPENRAEREQLCQYVLRNPFSVEKITLESPTDTIIYRSKLNPKINRNFEVFDPVDFLAVLSQHIPDKNFQMVRYYGLYSNKMRGCARKASGAGGGAPWPKSSPPPPAKFPSRKWRDLIRQAWHTDPLECPECHKTMRVIAVIDNPSVIEKILRHLNLWCGPAKFAPARPPPSADPPEPDPQFPIDSDPMPDYENVITD